MQCPNDQTTLVMSERKGIEVDYCPSCRGVWLDRGELDKIIERSLDELGAASDAGARAATGPASGGPGGPGGPAGPAPGPAPATPHYPPQPDPAYGPPPVYEPGYRREGLAYPPRRRFGSSASAGSPDEYGRYGYPHHRRRRGSFLGDLFDF